MSSIIKRHKKNHMLYDFVDIVLNDDQWELAFMVEH